MTAAQPPASPAASSSANLDGPPSPLSQSSAPFTPRRQVVPTTQLPHPSSAPSALPGSPTQRRRIKQDRVKQEMAPPASPFSTMPAPNSSHLMLPPSAVAASPTPSRASPALNPSLLRRSTTVTTEHESPRRGATPFLPTSTALRSSSTLPEASSSAPAQSAQAHRDGQPAGTATTRQSEGSVAIELPGESTSSAVVISDDDDVNDGGDARQYHGLFSSSVATDQSSDNQQPAEAGGSPLYTNIRLLDGEVSLTAGLFKSLPSEFRQAFHPLPKYTNPAAHGEDAYLLEETVSTFNAILEWYRSRALPESSSERARLRKRALRLGLNGLGRQLQQAPSWVVESMKPSELEELERSLVLGMLGCERLQDIRWAEGQQDGIDILTSFQTTIQRVERHLQEGRRGPCGVDWGAVWGSSRYWPFWWHVQGPDEGQSTWQLEQQARPPLARAILLAGEVPPPPIQPQQRGSQSPQLDDDDGEGLGTSRIKYLRVESMVSAMSYRLLRNGIRLEKLTFVHAKEELWVQASPFDPMPA